MAVAGAVLLGCTATGREDGGGLQAEPTPRPAPTTGTAQQGSPGDCPTGAGMPLPADFPRGLPVPEDATVTGVERRSKDRLIVEAVTHHGFEAALTYLQQKLPEAGFRLEAGEVEEHDAESDFSSARVDGRWTLRVVPGCPDAVRLTYLTAPTRSG